MSDAKEVPTLVVRGREIKALPVSVRQARPLSARLKEPDNDVLVWVDDVLKLLCAPEDYEVVAEVPLAEIGLENVIGFFYHAAIGVNPRSPTPPTST